MIDIKIQINQFSNKDVEVRCYLQDRDVTGLDFLLCKGDSVQEVIDHTKELISELNQKAQKL